MGLNWGRPCQANDRDIEGKAAPVSGRQGVTAGGGDEEGRGGEFTMGNMLKKAVLLEGL